MICMHATATPTDCGIGPLLINMPNVGLTIKVLPVVNGFPEPDTPPPITKSPALHDAVNGICPCCTSKAESAGKP